MADTEFMSRAASKADSDEGFAKFMADPMTRLILSKVPDTGEPEMLQTLLRAAFDAGRNSGVGACVIDIIGHMGKNRR